MPRAKPQRIRDAVEAMNDPVFDQWLALAVSLEVADRVQVRDKLMELGLDWLEFFHWPPEHRAAFIAFDEEMRNKILKMRTAKMRHTFQEEVDRRRKPGGSG